MLERTRKTILIVDDSPIVLEMAGSALEGAGYKVVLRSRGEGTVAAVIQERPDLVLLDVKLLPSMSGLDTLQYIKSFDERIEVVMITAFASLVTLNEALRRGAFGYLIKPFPRRDLALMVRDALVRRSGLVDGA
jgi:DNA-binding NtrC family response regulator